MTIAHPPQLRTNFHNWRKKALFLIAFGVPAILPAQVTLVKDGTPQAIIYYEAEGAIPPAVEDLAWHLQKMSGAKLSMEPLRNPGDVRSPAIVIGRTATALGAVPPEGEESYRLLTKGGNVLIGANSAVGASHGIYGFLEALGCDWVMPGEIGVIAPASRTVTAPALDAPGQPAFVVRDLWYSGGKAAVNDEERQRFEIWRRRQRLGTTIPKDNTGRGHAWGTYIRRNKQAFQKDPSMLALVPGPDGEPVRKGPQLDPAHPTVAELIAQNIRDDFAKKGWPKTALRRFAIGPADGDGYSISPEAQALGAGRKDPILGGYDVTDQVVYLANEVIKRLGDEYPNVILSYLCYSLHEQYPARHKPHPRVMVIFAPISYSRLHPTNDPASPTRSYYGTVLEQWKALHKEQGNPLGFYEYNWNLAENLLPFTRVGMVGEDIPMYYDAGVRWGIIECIKAWSINAPHDYLSVKLLWNPKQDWKTLLHRFCQLTFGAAGPMMERYYLRIAERQRVAGSEAGSYYSAPFVFDNAFLAAARADFDEAGRQKLREEEKIRLGYARGAFVILEHYLAMLSSLNSFDFTKAAAEQDALLANWESLHAANSDLVAAQAPKYLKLFFGATGEAAKFSAQPYAIVHKIDDELPTTFDPAGAGRQMGLHRPEINDTFWIRTKTYSSNWDAQGLGLIREGSVWYRHHFDLPDVTKLREGIGLFLGGFDDGVRIWLNGRFVGQTEGRKFAKPVTFDLTDAAQPGRSNLLAIEVFRNSQLNEKGTGGLLRPGFIFTGPRLAPAATNEKKPEERVLPGGGVEVQ